MHRFASVAAIAVVVSAGCSGQRNDVSMAATPTMLAWGHSRTMQETDSAVLVSPLVLFSRDTVIAVDRKEARVSLYAIDGRLLLTSSHHGQGPGEFEHATSVARSGSGSMLITDMFSGIVELGSDGQDMVREINLKLSRYDDVLPWSETYAVVGGARDSSLFHVWDMRNDTIIRSFFNPREHATDNAFVRSALFNDIARAGDTLVVTFSVSDSVFYYSIEGKELGAVRVPADTFRIVTPPENPRISNDMAYRRKYLASFELMTNVFVMRDGTIAVAYRTLDESVPAEPTYHLVHMTRDGRRLSITAVPPVLGMDPSTDSLYFIAPDSDTPNVWVSALLKPDTSRGH